MQGVLTSCSQSARSEPRKDVWCGVSRWFGPRPRRSILFRAPRCRLPCIASDPFVARLPSPRSRTSELTWQIIYTSPSLTGVRAAALAGLAITPISPSSLIAGLRILGVEEGLPPLPDIEFAIYEKARSDKAAAALAAVLLTLAPGLSRPAI
jgi:DNA-binding transcriptional LysR family regulator